MATPLAFLASETEVAQQALSHLTGLYDDTPLEKAGVIVALGGDGFMLQTLHSIRHLDIPTYGMNCGTIGFLMNEYAEEGLIDRVEAAEEEVLHPLHMRAGTADGGVFEALAINEVALLRAGPQAAKLRITVDGKLRMPELVCDGALVSTPAGSTAYNYSAHGPILPIGSDALALTAMSAFRPRRWRGALLPRMATVRFDVLEAEKRMIMADADSRHSVKNVIYVEVRSATHVHHKILFDLGLGLVEGLIREKFVC
ncbi:MAG: NAD kinase [Pseudomonadota bacterium]